MKHVYQEERKCQTRRHHHSREAEATTEQTLKEENTNHQLVDQRDMCCTNNTCASPALAGQHNQMHGAELEKGHGPWASSDHWGPDTH